MPNPNRGSVGFQSSEFEQEYERPSKSQLKRDSTALQKLGQDLIDEPRDRVKRVPMPEDVREAILECQLIKDHEGRRRQLQFVGKKMRTLDADEIAVIQKTIDSWRGQSKSDTAAMHALERRRDKLLTDDQALTDLLGQHPQLDAQQLRTLIRNARKEQAENKPPKAYREIFQILKQLQSGGKPAAGADADDGADEADEGDQSYNAADDYLGDEVRVDGSPDPADHDDDSQGDDANDKDDSTTRPARGRARR
jgi:ribosome-associated protein